MKYDVFISYSSKNQKTVEAICAYLEQHKIRCFVAYRDIPKGVVWARAIVDALEESRMMIVVFSEEFNVSDQVDREIELASEDKKPILTFRISNADFKGAKKYYLKNLNWIDAYPRPEESFGTLLTNVAKLLDIKVTPDAAPSFSVKNAVIKNVRASKTYRVGDYYDVDGVRGVVFEVDNSGRHGKIVSLEQTNACWCSSSQYDKKIIVEASSLTDGMYNTDVVMYRSESREYPAFVWCRKKGENWYLPAKEELLTIYDHETEINATLAEHGASRLAEWYWSSSEWESENDCYAWHISMRGGRLGCYKSCNNLVRAVSVF